MTSSTSQDRPMEEGENPSPIITEGKAKMIFPKDVFYNPVQVLNRDLRYGMTLPHSLYGTVVVWLSLTNMLRIFGDQRKDFVRKVTNCIHDS